MRWFISIVLVAMVCGCTQDKADTPRKADNAALVKLAVAETRDVTFIIEAVGTVKPSTTVTLVSRTAGELVCTERETAFPARSTRFRDLPLG